MRYVSRAAGAILATALLGAASQTTEGSMDVSITITPSAGALIPGDDVTYLVEVTNHGPDPGAVTIDLDVEGDAITAPPVPGPGLVCDEPERCVADLLQPGQTAAASLTAWPLSPEPLEHRATAGSSLPDPAPDNNLATQVTEVTGEACTQSGTMGDDVLDGTGAHDVLCGLGGDDTMSGMGEDDELRGGAGDDVLDGGPGDDLLTGGEDHDTASFAHSDAGVTVDVSAGTASGDGEDTLGTIEGVAGSPSDDVLVGGPVPGVLSGAAGTDLLFAGPAGDRLEGGEGDDYLEGAAGTDDLDGGPGTNTCVWDDLDAAMACLTSDPSDGDDVRGRLDLRGVVTSLGSDEPRFTFVNRKRLRRRSLWDRGYFVVALDTASGPGADRYGIGRANRRGWRGLMTTAGGRSVRGISVRREGSRSLRIRVRLPAAGQGRVYYRWWVVTAWTGKRCTSVCLDRIPRSGSMVQPIP